MPETSTRKSRRPRVLPTTPFAEKSLVRRWAIGIFERLSLIASVGAGAAAIIMLLLVIGLGLGVSPSPVTTNGSVGLVLVPSKTATATATATLTPMPPPDIAILAGHWSRDDPLGVTTVHDTGALCPDGLREVTINKSVADKVITLLRGRGFHVDLLEEFDQRLKSVSPDFAPAVFLSIHSDSCVSGPEYPYATGFKIAHAEPSENPGEDDRLVACLRKDYQKAVSPYNLAFNENTITVDMTAYHAFHEIVETTPAAIIELGFMANDRPVLTLHQDELARGVALGLVSFLQGDRCGSPPDTVSPTVTPTSP